MNQRHGPNRQRGAAAVEFAIISVVFFTLLIGIMEMGRMLFYWNTVTEMTRLGARLAAICEPGNPRIAERITTAFPAVPIEAFEVSYLPENCEVGDTCRWASVRVVPGFRIANVIPFVPAAVNSLAMPEFKTTVPREGMPTTFTGTPNPICG